jgi:hypothetical protein
MSDNRFESFDVEEVAILKRLIDNEFDRVVNSDNLPSMANTAFFINGLQMEIEDHVAALLTLEWNNEQ